MPVAWLLSDEFSRAVIVHYANKIWDAFDRAMAKEYTRRKGSPRENVAPITHFDFSFRAADKVTYTHGTPRKGGAAKKVIEEGLIEIRIKSGGKPIDD